MKKYPRAIFHAFIKLFPVRLASLLFMMILPLVFLSCSNFDYNEGRTTYEDYLEVMNAAKFQNQRRGKNTPASTEAQTGSSHPAGAKPLTRVSGKNTPVNSSPTYPIYTMP